MKNPLYVLGRLLPDEGVTWGWLFGHLVVPLVVAGLLVGGWVYVWRMAEYQYFRGFYSFCVAAAELPPDLCNEVSAFVKNEYDGFRKESPGYVYPE